MLFRNRQPVEKLVVLNNSSVKKIIFNFKEQKKRKFKDWVVRKIRIFSILNLPDDLDDPDELKNDVNAEDNCVIKDCNVVKVDLVSVLKSGESSSESISAALLSTCEIADDTAKIVKIKRMRSIISFIADS